MRFVCVPGFQFAVTITKTKIYTLTGKMQLGTPNLIFLQANIAVRHLFWTKTCVNFDKTDFRVNVPNLLFCSIHCFWVSSLGQSRAEVLLPYSAPLLPQPSCQITVVVKSRTWTAAIRIPHLTWLYMLAEQNANSAVVIMVSGSLVGQVCTHEKSASCGEKWIFVTQNRWK